MPPIGPVRKEVYAHSPGRGAAYAVTVAYDGDTGVRRVERRSRIASSDWADQHMQRTSDDNGRTWHDWQPVVGDGTNPTQGEFTMQGFRDRGGEIDPVSGLRIGTLFQRVVKGVPQEAMHKLWGGERLFCDHGFYQLTSADGQPLGQPRMLRYEPGPDFDANNWGDDHYWRTNEMYIGDTAVVHAGSVVIAATVPVPCEDDERDRDVPLIFPNNYRAGCVAGARCWVGRWNAKRSDYDWTLSNTMHLPRHVSSRGLVELNLNALSDGRLLLIMRGSNDRLDPNVQPGHKWISLSDDGGLTWSDVQPMCYDTGQPFNSPASISKTFRHARTGRLYFVGNITHGPSKANGPRYPLYVAEIDEHTATLKRDTMTLIDDRDPDRDSEHLQLSNFCILQDRESDDVEIYLARLGCKGRTPDVVFEADAWRYTVTVAS